MKRVLVTGGAGFVGRHAIPALAARGFEIHAAGRTEPEGVHAFHAADLLDPGQRRAAVQRAGASHLLHLAWVTTPGRYWQTPDNLDWTAASLDLVRAFRETGGRRAVVAGTCAEYDWTTIARLGEATAAGTGHLPESAPCDPATLYGAAKDGLHRILASYAASAGLSLAWGRLFYLYGPGETPGRLVGDAARALLAGQRLATSEGRQRRDFLHIADAGAAFSALLDAPVEGAVNIGSGTAVSVRSILEEIGARTGRPDLIDFGARPLGPAEPACIEADIRRLADEVGFCPRYGLKRGLAETVASWRAALSNGASGP
ncbi:NAD-dependent epimerase/dehydratase [Methylorubrum populi BJ001]|uniref:NAD-dependent epimerase/dehydratase n=1 Tax=Methylorubrum populi (strain ATCC BAA-705 / NCIMB 13946 / BJ001) TaxID=441620 RepID=B1Z7Y1_METPB|nr:NAD(P)-dependent oxidoreductase [Methylorubrum populi]ACB78952.1 NAD-dependent epimerase/dehydratase [Methylorubrum populi BJ001]OAH32343.1 NAD-dependent dehydratase [Methylorubrum populi]PZP71369.1 MAG: NAD(P)-dependent oxidoreductase [Methylorubrum populi]